MFEYFKNKYPKIFDENLIEFECGEGWKNILDTLFTKIYIDMVKMKLVVEQVKEKLGGLRCYISIPANDFICTAIEKAEKESYRTCEYCGSTENVKTEGGWLKTLCDKCRK